ncbi:MAG: hypothetical protein M5U31_13290 [Acidimicrobiia bacterium]|nr:hypothetical protein [Acidimicrobiia bacterium]
MATKRRTSRFVLLALAATAVVFAFEGRRRALEANGDPAQERLG